MTLTTDQWLALRKEAGLKIDPTTAELDWDYGQAGDPYGVRDLAPEEQQVGRNYFCRAPGTDIWVHFYDLPDATREALWRAVDNGTAKWVDREWPFEERK
jgi:hypothetical protein